MEYYPTALRLTSEKHGGWVYMEHLKRDMLLVQFAPQNRKPLTLSPLNVRYVPSAAHFATLLASE